VIIPTRGRPATLAGCLAALARQDLPPERYEVLVGVDGADAGEEEAVSRVLASGPQGVKVLVQEFPRAASGGGLAEVRNRLITRARGRILLSLNDDLIAEPQLCREHLRAHQAGVAAPGPATIVGDAPWRVRHPDRLFDLVLRRSSMIFFYNQMPGAHDYCPASPDTPPAPPGPTHDWGFRHAFGLNVSYPTAAVREVGGYAVYPEKYGFEDCELAFRLGARLGMPVRFHPRARGWHDHAYEPAGYLEREFALGRAAWGFAGQSPACARAMFRREIRSEAELARCRHVMAHERAQAERCREAFLGLAAIPAAQVAGPHQDAMVRLLYQQHLPVKRWEWCRGLLAGAATPHEDAPALETVPVSRGVPAA